MAWTNAFALGACTLSVHKNDSAAAMTAGEMVGDGVTASADGSGLVTLVTPENGSRYAARVIPQYSVVGAAVRLSGMAITANYAPSPVAEWDGLTLPDLLTYTDPGVTPDPTLFAIGEVWTYAGLSVQESPA